MTRIEPADAGQLIDFLSVAHRLTAPGLLYGRLLAQVSLSEAYAVFSTGSQSPSALAGIVPIEHPRGLAGEIWFCVSPAKLGASLLPALREARRVLALRRDEYPGGFFCLVRDGNKSGERLAALIGFEPQPFFLGSAREWSWQWGGGAISETT